MDNAPKFDHYTYEDLLDAKQNIDRERYPDRYQKINSLIANFDEKNGIVAEEIISNVNKYSTFWPRFWAAIIDGILFAIILYTECLILGIEYSTEDKFLQAVNGIQISIYFIFMHGLYGQTLGKMALGVMVLNHQDEENINIPQALKRESVNLAINTFWTVLIFAVSISMEWYGSISESLIYSAAIFGLLSILWALSEFVTMLFNQKRRALHDFIGGTVVVRKYKNIITNCGDHPA